MWAQFLGQEDPPGGGNGNPLQYSCMKNPMDRGAWWAAVQRVAKSQTQLNSRTANLAHSDSSWGRLQVFFFSYPQHALIFCTPLIKSGVPTQHLSQIKII